MRRSRISGPPPPSFARAASSSSVPTALTEAAGIRHRLYLRRLSPAAVSDGLPRRALSSASLGLGQPAGRQRRPALVPSLSPGGDPPGDALHWTGMNQTWNFMCADCHSTNLRRNYDVSTDSYRTSWSEIDVSCEACHGPGSRHVAWAKSEPPPDDPGQGLVAYLADRSGGRWVQGSLPLARRRARCRAPRMPRSRPVGSAMPGGMKSPRASPTAIRCLTARSRACCPRGSTSRMDRSRRRTTSTAPSCKAGCSSWASPAPIAMSRTV